MVLAEEIQSRAAELLSPISDAEPSGQNASFDPRYEAVRAAMASLDSPTGGEVEWVDIERSTRELLRSTSKDLLLASYFTFASLQTEGPKGLAVGIATLEGLLEQHWDTMFPPVRRLRGRGNAMGWLVDRLESSLASLALQASDRGAIDLIDTLWKQLGAKSRERLEDHSPSFRGVEDALTRIKLKLPPADPQAPAPPSEPPAAPVAPSPEPPAAPAPAAAPTPTSTATPESSDPAPAQPTGQPADPPASPSPVTAPATESPATDGATTPATQDDPLTRLRAEADPWSSPISDAAPTGDDARYDEAYEACRTEVSQLEAPTGGDPDWKKVEDLSSQLLKTKAKDLLMASYFAYARYQQRGLEALPLGLIVLERILDRYPDAVFPTRPRGRGNAVGWLFGQLEPALGRQALQPSDRETVEALDAVVKALASTVRERLGEHAPGTSPMTERLQRMLLAVPKPEPKPDPKPTPAPPPKPTPQAIPSRAPTNATANAGPMPSAAADVSSAEDVTKFLLETGRALVTAAGLLRRAELSSPAAYRLLRSGLWLHVHKAPPADAGGKTQIPPLPPRRRQQFETIAANAKWAALIEETESALQQFRFCLDLNHWTDRALEALGDAYAPARRALAGEVTTLVQRVPELIDFTAGDGSPLASEDTKQWIASLVPSSEGTGTSGRSDAADVEAMADVRGKIAAAPGDALKVARERIDDAKTPRSRFVRQLVLAEICLAANQPKLARGMFAALERDIESRHLRRWEPDLASRCLEGLVRSTRAANKAGGKHGGADEAFERLCLVDPIAAARLSS